jgi:hypothetical protein
VNLHPRTVVTRLAALLAAGVVLGAGFAAGSAVAGGGNAGPEIHACARDSQRSNAFLRLVNDPSECGPNEISVSWNEAGPAGAQGPAGPDGPGVLFVVVDAADGSLVTTSPGAGVVSAQKTSTGVYEVLFDHDITFCARWVVFGPRSPGFTYAATQNVADAGEFPVQRKAIFLAYDPAGNLADAHFAILVSCP